MGWSSKCIHPRKVWVELGALSIILGYGSVLFREVLPTFTLSDGLDGPFTSHLAQMFTNSFPFYLWEPYAFNGSPMLAVGPAIYTPLAILLKLGLDATNTFFFSFWFFFLLFGVVLYFLTKQLTGSTLIALSMPFIAWASDAIWNATIWGGSYDRMFSVPFLFIGITVTYKYISQKTPSTKLYLLTLLTWVVLLLVDMHVTFQFLMVAPLMVIFSCGKNLLTGVKKAFSLLLPAMAITFFEWGGLVYYMFTTPNLAAQADTALSPISTLFTNFGESSAAGYLPVPIIIIACFILAYFLIKHRVKIEPARVGLLIALLMAGAYYFIRGWIPQLWPFLPRIEGEADNIADLADIFMVVIPALLGLVLRSVANKPSRPAVVRSKSIMPTDGFGSSTQLWVAAFFLVALANATLLIPTIQPQNYTALTTTMDSGLTSLNAYQPEYRLGVVEMAILNWINYVHPQVETTGGRLAELDAMPLYNSWFEDVVFYGGVNPSTVNYSRLEDVPPIYEPYFSTDIRNTATSIFWLDWMGVKEAVSTQYEPTKAIDTIRESQPFFNVSTVEPSSGTVLTGTSSPTSGTIAEQTDAKILGFLGSANDYNLLLASLSYIGLGPSYVIPLKLTPGELGQVKLDTLIVDSSAWEANPSEVNAVVSSGVPVFSVPDTVTAAPASSSHSLSYYQSLGPTGSYDLIRLVLPSLINNGTTAVFEGKTTSGYVYQLPNPLVYTSNMLLQINTSEAGNISLEVGTGNSNASVTGGVSVENGVTVIPFTMFSGKIAEFGQIITNGSVDSISIVSLIKPTQASLIHTWKNGNEGVINGITGGFEGVIFKETYYSNWRFYSGSNTLPVYYAGPGMIYIPLPPSGINSVEFYFTAYDGVLTMSIILAVATTMVIAVWTIRQKRTGIDEF